MKVYFNNSCKICKAEIDLYKKEKIQEIDWIDITNNDLAEKEEKEVDVLSKYKPAQLSENEISAKVKEAIEQSAASSMQDMGKVMGILKPLSGSADMGLVSKIVKDELS